MKLPAAVATKFGHQMLLLKKNSPQIAFVGGVAAGLGSTVLACRATLKLSETLEGFEKIKVESDELRKIAEKDDTVDYDEKTYAKDQTVIKVKTLLAITKLYAPAAGLAVISVGLLTGSHVTLTKRNTSLAAAYAATDQAFKQYRERVREQLGRDVDDEMRYGSKTVSETVEDDNGKKKVVKHTRVADGVPSQYARFFDESCAPFQRNPEYNKIFLQAQQGYFNDMLQAEGHVFLNDVYQALGLPKSQAGQVVGWVLSKDGDNFVDFGIFDNPANPQVRAFVNGHEHSILLDFNVDGVVLDKVKWLGR